MTTTLVDTNLANTTASVTIQENLSTSSTTNEEGNSSGHVFVTEASDSRTTYSALDSSTREMETTAYVDTRSFASESSSNSHVSTSTHDVRASSTEMTSSAAEEAPQRPTELGTSRSESQQEETSLEHMTTKQTEDTAFVTSAPSVARKSTPTAGEAIAKDSDAEKSVSLTTQNTMRDTPFVLDITHETGGLQLTIDSEYITQLTTHADVVRQQSGHVSFRSLSITDTIVGDSEPTTTGLSTRQRNLILPMTTASLAAAASSFDVELDSKRMSTAPLPAEDMPHTVSSASTKTTLPVLRYKHRKVTLDIPLMASLLVLAALLSTTIGVGMWVIVKRRERANRNDQELTPIATAYSF